MEHQPWICPSCNRRLPRWIYECRCGFQRDPEDPVDAGQGPAVSATATYLAFVRSGPHRARPWITLAAGTLLTAFVSYERVRSGEHFPTDVIMGSMAGAAIGVLVPHFHHRPHIQEKSYCAPPVWIGFQPSSSGSGAFTLGGLF